ncbi:hypothetical protein EYF80_059346 [Liparis tanakae]|uniref:Uncharacterized protein n=1 Tax=Liparis tanakae TaxID=230148 RepID=A0A4Z2EQB3_9TELE|nr:hypothetical protein EYF80_059346 [Liparis tanakae]
MSDRIESVLAGVQIGPTAAEAGSCRTLGLSRAPTDVQWNDPFFGTPHVNDAPRRSPERRADRRLSVGRR